MEAVGSPQTFGDSLKSVMVGGTVICIGVGKQNLDFDFNIIQRKHLNILGSRNAVREDFLETIAIARDGKLGDIKKLVSCVYDYKDAAKAYDYVTKHNNQVLKCLLRFE
jgi:threonine dehydrogenase-like Zn-dependent dehydrogenase